MGCDRFFFGPPSPCNKMFFLGEINIIFQGSRTMEDNQATRKRPFFTLGDEAMYDEEYYDEQLLPEKKRRLSTEQVVMLEESFEEDNKLEPERKSELAKRLGLQPRQVAVWFQNRRARSKSKQLERDYDLLKASYDTLVSKYEAVLKENEQLKAEVLSLNEKLQSKEANGPSTVSSPVQLLYSEAQVSGPQISAVEDWPSSESGASAAVNQENYFYCLSPHCIATVHSEEDDISDDGDGRSLFPPFTLAVDHQREEEEENGQDLGWWVWS